jgi:hypothetical protein
MKPCKRLTLFLFVFVGLVQQTWAAREDEISLFNSRGKAQAYIETSDNFTVSLWTGEPVAYLVKDAQGFVVWGFNGKHLGWLVRGMVFDHEGYVVAAFKECFKSGTQLEELKDLKNLKPLKSLKELPPLRPLFKKEWSEDWSTRAFLNQGKSD